MSDRPIDVIQRAGIADFEELEHISSQSRQTLINWFNNPKKGRLFECVVEGAAAIKAKHTATPDAFWQWESARLCRKYAERDEVRHDALRALAKECAARWPNHIYSDTSTIHQYLVK